MNCPTCGKDYTEQDIRNDEDGRIPEPFRNRDFEVVANQLKHCIHEGTFSDEEYDFTWKLCMGKKRRKDVKQT